MKDSARLLNIRISSSSPQLWFVLNYSRCPRVRRCNRVQSNAVAAARGARFADA